VTLAQFLYDGDTEQWWIEPADGEGIDERQYPSGGVVAGFVIDVPDEILAELVAVRHRYGFLMEDIVSRAGLHPTEPHMMQPCHTFTAERELTAENTTLGDPDLLARLIGWQLCTGCGWPRDRHESEVPASDGSPT
jgi:hypothetical protein